MCRYREPKPILSDAAPSAPESGRSFHRRALVATAALLAVLLALMFWLHGVYVEREQRHRHQAERELQSINQLQLRALREWRRDTLRDAAMLVEDGLLADALMRWQRGNVALQPLVAERLRALRELGRYTAVYYVSDDGVVLFGANGERTDNDAGQVPAGELPALRTALATAAPVMGEPTSGPVFAFPYVSVFAPLYDSVGAVGAVWLVQDLRVSLLPLVEPWPTPSQTARSNIVWRDGNRARYLSPPRGVQADPLAYSYPLDSGRTAVAQALEGVRGVFYAEDEAEHAVMAMASPVFGTDWLLVSAVEVAEVFADVRRRELLALTLPVSLLLLAGAVGSGVFLRRAWQRERALTLALQHAMGGLEAELRIDPLTGAANRRAIDETARFQLAMAVRGGTPLSVLMLDVDHFKRFNDYYGHLAGDQCLKRVAAALRTQVARAGELVGRYGGEEFAVLLPLCDAKSALERARRMCKAVHDLHIAHQASPDQPWVTISIGVACLKPEDVAIELARMRQAPDSAGTNDWPLLRQLFEQADRALYEAKRRGRNRAVLSDEVARDTAAQSGT